MTIKAKTIQIQLRKPIEKHLVLVLISLMILSLDKYLKFKIHSSD